MKLVEYLGMIPPVLTRPLRLDAIAINSEDPETSLETV